MQVLTRSELDAWLTRSFGERRADHVCFDNDGLFFSNPEARAIELRYPSTCEKLPFFTRHLACIGYEEADFRGAMLWFEDWSVWNPLEQGIGYRLVEAFHRANGQQASFEIGLAHSFRPDEFVETVGLLMQPMIFSWDAYYLPRWSFGSDEFFLYLSHDSFASVITRTKAFRERIFQELQHLKVAPQVSDRLTERFCR